MIIIYLVLVSCFNKIQIGFTFLVPAHPGSPGKKAVKRVCVCVWCVTDDDVANISDNSSVCSLIQMHYFLSALADVQ